jgi:hypothetical protein
MLKMGQKAKDKITSFAGIVTGRTEYITGCNQLLLQPPLDKDETFRDPRWIDEDRLEAVGDDVLELEVTAPGPDVPAPAK